MLDRVGPLPLALCAALASGCSGPAGERETSPTRPLLEDAVERGLFQTELLLTGELRAVRSVALSAPQTSVMQMRIQFMAEEGSSVEVGDPLLRFDDSGLAARVLDLEASILDAETRLVAQRADFESSLRDLEIELAEKIHDLRRAELEAAVDEGILSRQEHSERQLALAKAREQLEETKERIESTKKRGEADLDVLRIEQEKLGKDLLSAVRDVDQLSIEAPAAGLVVYAERERSTQKWNEGDSCWPGQTLLRLPDLSEMEVVFRVSEVDAPLLELGLPVSLTLDSFPGRRLDGRVAHLPSMAVKRREDSQLSIFEVTCSLAETWVGEMKPGMSVQGRVVIESMDDAQILKRSAVRHDGQRYWALTRRGGRLHEVEVSPLARNATHYLLADGTAESLLARLAGESTT